MRLLETNIYDTGDTIIIVGTCLSRMQPEGFKKLTEISSNIYELCLEESHVNMAIAKIGSMLRTCKVKKVIFASVDKSPHCVQMHYIGNELKKMMDLSNIDIINYVVVNNELVLVSENVIKLSKNLAELMKASTN